MEDYLWVAFEMISSAKSSAVLMISRLTIPEPLNLPLKTATSPHNCTPFMGCYNYFYTKHICPPTSLFIIKCLYLKYQFEHTLFVLLLKVYVFITGYMMQLKLDMLLQCFSLIFYNSTCRFR